MGRGSRAKKIVLKGGDGSSDMNPIDRVIEINRRNSALYTSPAVTEEREKYRRNHPTEICFLKCMDGRVHGPVITHTPLGVIQPFRNLGGKFDLGWPILQHTFKSWKTYSQGKLRDCLVVVTYHFSRGNVHRGCAGFNYDTPGAIAFTRNLKEQFVEDFGQSSALYTIQVGIETDLDALIIHGDNGERIDLAEVADVSESMLRSLLHGMYPKMSERMVEDLLPLVTGNIAHIADVRKNERQPVALEHREWILGFGRGFDWLHEINQALIVGPFDPDFKEAITIAGKVLLSNIEARRIEVPMKGGIVLLASVPYHDVSGPEPRQAARKARYLASSAYETLRERLPALTPHIDRLTVTIDQNTRKMNIIERD